MEDLEKVEVEPTAEEDVQEEASEQDVQPEEQPKEKHKGGIPEGVQRRIDQLTKRYYDEKAAREAAEARLKENKPPEQAPQAKPKYEDFNSEEEYFDKLADWKLEQRLSQQQKQAEAAQQAEREKLAAQDYEKRRDNATLKGLQAFDDFEDVVLKNEELAITPQMVDIFTQSERGHEIAYYLGKHPAEAYRIADLNPAQQALEFGKIEAKLSAPQKKKTTQAPDPVEPVGGRGAQPSNLDPVKNFKEWAKQRNEGKI